MTLCKILGNGAIGPTLGIRSPTINRRILGPVEPQLIYIPLVVADLWLLSIEYRDYRPHISLEDDVLCSSSTT